MRVEGDPIGPLVRRHCIHRPRAARARLPRGWVVQGVGGKPARRIAQRRGDVRSGVARFIAIWPLAGS